MWAKLDDALIDHKKLFLAGDVIGTNGPAVALGVYALGVLYANKHLTDGFLAESVVRHWKHVARPGKIADAMVVSKLWERVEGGYQIHDFHDFNPHAEDVHAKRRQDRERKKRGGRNRYAQSVGNPNGSRVDSLASRARDPVPDPVPDPRTRGTGSSE